jgi:hypothetical protein
VVTPVLLVLALGCEFTSPGQISTLNVTETTVAFEGSELRLV